MLTAPPFTLDVSCADTGGGNVVIRIGAKSTEANSALNGATLSQDADCFFAADGFVSP